MIGIVFLGLLLAVAKHSSNLYLHRRIFEKGALFALFGSVGMGFINFLTGISSHIVSPLATIWFMHSFIAIFCFIYFVIRGEIASIVTDLRRYPKIIAIQSICDNAAWIAYAIAMSLIPISVATAVSESYIAFLVLLGIFVNKDKVQKHQVIGIIFTVVAVITLALIFE